MILRLKYSHLSGLGKPMGQALAKKMNIDLRADFLVPIPLHRNSTRKFNQALLISKGLQLEWRIPVKDILKWNCVSVRQTKKQLEDRKKLDMDAFSIDPSLIRGKRVIIFDDVITTGTTLTRAMNILRASESFPIAAVTWTATI